MRVEDGDTYIENEADWFAMKINDTAYLDNGMEAVRRVPGGWVHMRLSPTGGVASSFIPIHFTFK